MRYVQNITDVGHLLDTGEDRILKGAARERSSRWSWSRPTCARYFEDMDALGVTRPDISPRASGHIPEQIEIAQSRCSKRAMPTRSTARSISTCPSWPEYGKLSGRSVEEQEAGARVEVREEKRHPADFALWKKAEPEHILRWNSPWGVGLSRLARRVLGHVDQVPGRDVRHSRRRAGEHLPAQRVRDRAERGGTGKPFARYWLLAGSLTVDGVKMSKSLGNFVTIKDALKTYRPEAIRFFILSSHYRNPVDYTEEALNAAEAGGAPAWRGGARSRSRAQLRRTAMADAGRAGVAGQQRGGSSMRWTTTSTHRARWRCSST